MPTTWAAAAVAYRLTCPLARDDALSARLVSSAVLCTVITGLVLHVRRTLLRELRRARGIAGSPRPRRARCCGHRHRGPAGWPSPRSICPPTGVPGSAVICMR
ncbi:hypothetical protein [Streptomyces sp. SM1]|uniref:hypothetical protein n=1 Tax=Streptomyces sp. SM1 TaxID=402229 RepID=UPI0035BC20DD